MKRYVGIIFLTLCFFRGVGQCPDVYTDINNNTAVCGVYGDANGNSNWNWEITDKNNSNYCNNWYARTSSISTKLTAMGSPFVDATTSALDLIAQNQDFTKAKGWELLRRDFGCSHVTAYPYFVLYNKYSGLMRVYVYQPENQPQYSGTLLQIEPTKTPYPATTAFGDELVTAPDKYLNSSSSSSFGKMVIAVSEPGGSSRWSVTEFNPAFDPNIQNAVYTGTGLKFTIFGVLTFGLQATIKGRSVSSTDPKVYNFNYVPNSQNAPTSSDGGQTFSFKAEGEKFIKFAKDITEVRNKVHTTATNVYTALNGINVFEKTPLGKVKSTAFAVQQISSSTEGFGKALGSFSEIISKGGVVMKAVGSIIGLFSGASGATTPAPMPTYTNYDLVLNGTMTAKNIQETFILRVPATIQNDNSNTTYYKCPIGIFNIKNTPEADTVVYRRIYEWDFNGQYSVTQWRNNYTSYKIRNDLAVSFNSGAGLELVSTEAAIVGEILPDVNGNASYDLFKEHFIEDPGTYQAHAYYNFMLGDLQSGRTEVSFYDTEKGLHEFQTPYVNLECLKGLAFNALATTKIFLRVKAIMKKQGDPNNIPVIFVKDYKIDCFQGTLTAQQRWDYDGYAGRNILPPYANYTQVPSYTSDVTISNTTYSTGTTVSADNSVETQNTITVNSSSEVIFTAGSSVILKPGFTATNGSSFRATINSFGYNITCGTPQIEAYQFSGNCYNNTATALRTRQNPIEEESKEIQVFPTLSKGSLNISGSDLLNSQITIVDISGKVVQTVSNKSQKNLLNLNVNYLTNGTYIIVIKKGNSTVSKKFIVAK